MMESGTFSVRNAVREAELLRQVDACLQASDIPRAVLMARNALAGGFVHPLLLNLRSMWLEEQGRENEALEDLKLAVSIAPEDASIQSAYGNLLVTFQKRPEAIAALETAIRLAPNYAPVHYNMGLAKETFGELKESQLSYEKALALEPNYPDAIAHLASLAYRRSDWDEAYALADRALAIDSKHALALITQARTAIAQKDFERAETILAKLNRVSRKDIPKLDHAVVPKIMGDLRHAQGRYAEAFAAYSESNTEKLRIFSPRYAAPGVETAYSHALWLAEYFKDVKPESWAARQDDGSHQDDAGGAAGHVILGGAPRSGTTLLASVFDCHRDIVSLDEKNLLGNALHVFLSNDAGRERLAKLGADEIARYRAIYWENVKIHGVDVKNKVFVDKHPFLYDKLPMMMKFFPGIKVLFALRDPRDVVLSCFRHSFTMHASTFQLLSLETAARFYDATMRVNMIYSEKFALPWHIVRHEGLVENFEAEMSKACSFLGLKWDEGMREFSAHAKTRAIATPSSIQVMRGLNQEGIGQWRHYAKELAPILPVLKPWVEKFGYPPD